MSIVADRKLNTKAAAQALGCSEQFLKMQRLRGRGPAYLRVGRSVKYAESDLASYLESRRIRSTAQGINLD